MSGGSRVHGEALVSRRGTSPAIPATAKERTFTPGAGGERVNYTAVLHAVATLTVAVGFLFVSGDVQLAVFGVGAVLFVAGIVVARLDTGEPEAT